MTFRVADISPEHVRLTWNVNAPGLRGGTVFRRELSSSWASVGRIELGVPGTASFEDASIEAGHGYGYRVEVATREYQSFLGRTWIDVPAWALRLLRISPNPALGPFDVAFSLASNLPARLEAFDVAGRRRLTRDLIGFPQGSHTMRIDPRGWPAGVYVIRLTQGGNSVTRKTCVLH